MSLRSHAPVQLHPLSSEHQLSDVLSEFARTMVTDFPIQAQRFPVDVVKIDQTFVADLQHNEASDAIVFAVVELAHRLGMTVVAEGVETAEQLAKLSSFGCDYCQGNYFARPMSADDFDEILLRPAVAIGTARLPVRAERRS